MTASQLFPAASRLTTLLMVTSAFLNRLFIPFMRGSPPLMLPRTYSEKLHAMLYATISGEYSDVLDFFSTFRCSLMTM